MKEEGIAIRYAFRALEYGFPLLLIAISLVPARVPSYVSSAALAFLALLLAVWTFKRDRIGDLLRITLYLTIPIAVYEGASAGNGWMKGIPFHLCNAAFVLLVLLDIAVSKLTKRREGFRSTPLDFLILAIAVGAPNLPEQNLQAYKLGLVAAKTIILYFSFEVLMADLRGKLGGLALAAGIALAALSIKGFL
jgi:UDP-GlcNAc:undecaprenyl-phosphate GlcNAc-1-phosphate transferase